MLEQEDVKDLALDLEHHLDLRFVVCQRVGTATHSRPAQEWLETGDRADLRSIFEAAPSGKYYYTKGFNFLAVGGVIIGQVAYFLIYNPFTGEASPLFQYLPASIAAFLLPALVYWIGMRFWMEPYLDRRVPITSAEPERLQRSNL
jgi:hypothetical protein